MTNTTTAIKLFKQYLILRKKKLSTINFYIYDLQNLYNLNKIDNVEDFSQQTYQYLLHKPYNKFNRLISSFNNFIRFLLRNKIISHNLTIKNFSKVNNQVKYISSEQLKNLFFELRNEPLKLIKFEILYETGIKLNELILLKKDNLLLKKNKSFLVIGERILEIPKNLYLRLLDIASKHKDSPYLFVDSQGKPYSYRNMREELSNSLQKSGIFFISASSFRNSYIINKIKEGLDFNEIAYLCGISNKRNLEKFKIFKQ
jgi:site-specific recombinase XerD